MSRRHLTTGQYSVGGDHRKLPSLTAAYSLAQTLATQTAEPRRFGVFDNGTKVGRVERHEDGSISTWSLLDSQTP